MTSVRTDMTNGVIWKSLVAYSVPILLGDLLQQLYNMADSVIVGRCVGKAALAAVGCTSPIINTLIGLFMGISMGSTVVIAQYYGANDKPRLRKAVHTTIAITFIAGVIMALIGVLSTDFMLRLMKTPDDVYPEAKIYLTIYFTGILGLVMYNMTSGILRAVGDSRHPLYFLCFSAATNIVLDLVFVVNFKLGVAGAALATVISQFVSAILILFMLMRSCEVYSVSVKEVCIDKKILMRIINIGVPFGLQRAITAFSNVVVQSFINSFGSGSMAGWSVYSKIDMLIFMPLQSLMMAITTFTGQNLGAGKPERIIKGTRVCVAMMMTITVAVAVILSAFAQPIIMLFNSEPDVLKYGTTFIRFILPWAVTACVSNALSGTLRGIGNSQAPMLLSLFSFVVFRQLYLNIGTLFFDSIYFVAFSYPAGWIVCSIVTMLYYRTHIGKILPKNAG